MKRQAGRPSKNSAQFGQDFNGKYSVEILAEQVEESRMQVQRHIRLNYLIPTLLEQVDQGGLKTTAAADFISHLTEKEQTYLAYIMERDEVSPSISQAKQLKELSADGLLTEGMMDRIMREEKTFEIKVTLKQDKLKKYFPKDYTPQKMEEVIIKLLETWSRQRQREQSR